MTATNIDLNTKVDLQGNQLLLGGLQNNGVGIFAGAGAPTFAAPKGSLYLATDGSSTSTRLFVCSVASGTWVAVTTAS
jgi:hypothetical protein